MKKIRSCRFLTALLLAVLLVTGLVSCRSGSGQTAAGSMQATTAPGSGSMEESADPGGEVIQETADPGGEAVQETAAPGQGKTENAETAGAPGELPEQGSYTTREDVSLYLHIYGHLPENFITKKQAKKLGWEGGNLEPYAPGKCIGGDHFGNYEGILPEDNGEEYFECDIDTLGKKSRGAKRLVYTEDGVIYYTEDHYQTFVKLYGD